jgi:hypothetical protein
VEGEDRDEREGTARRTANRNRKNRKNQSMLLPSLLAGKLLKLLHCALGD